MRSRGFSEFHEKKNGRLWRKGGEKNKNKKDDV